MGDHVDVDVPGQLHRGLADAASGERAQQPSAPAGAEDQLGGVLGAGEVEQRARDVVADDRVRAAAQGLDQLALGGQRGRAGVGEAVAAGDVDGQQLAAGRAVGDPGGTADQSLPLGTAGEGDDDAFAGLPDPADAVLRAVGLQALVDPPGEPQQGEFAQRGEVADPEVVGERGVDRLGGVHVAVRHPAAQALGGHVDELDLGGPADHLVRHGLALRHPGDRLDDVVQRLQVLDVDRGQHVDTGVEQFLDVLPALVVAPAGDVGVGELVDQGDLGAAGDHRLGVHLGELRAPVAAVQPGQHLQAFEQVLGVPPGVALDVGDDHVGAAFLPAPGLVQHPVGLAHPGGRTEQHFQAAPAAPGAHVVRGIVVLVRHLRRFLPLRLLTRSELFCRQPHGTPDEQRC